MHLSTKCHSAAHHKFHMATTRAKTLDLLPGGVIRMVTNEEHIMLHITEHDLELTIRPLGHMSLPAMTTAG